VRGDPDIERTSTKDRGIDPSRLATASYEKAGDNLPLAQHSGTGARLCRDASRTYYSAIVLSAGGGVSSTVWRCMIVAAAFIHFAPMSVMGRLLLLATLTLSNSSVRTVES
jgi:hypothetical protein